MDQQMNALFEDLFVLELANNHWGRIDRGIEIVRQFGTIVRRHSIKAAIKLQLRDVDTFVHKQFHTNRELRYVKKTIDTRMSHANFKTLVDEIRSQGMLVAATPFDEKSVEQAVSLGADFLKIASCDLDAWPLIVRISETGLPVIASTGGAGIESIRVLIEHFNSKSIPIALNHCVSIYPSRDEQLELNQIDFLRHEFPNTTIGFSTHEFTDWETSIAIAYAKGARTFERHIDIIEDGMPVSPYCTLPGYAERWFTAWKRARAMCGGSGLERRMIPQNEIDYLKSLHRGVYLKHSMLAGENVTRDDVYFAIPCQPGQMSVNNCLLSLTLTRDVQADAPVKWEDFIQ